MEAALQVCAAGTSSWTRSRPRGWYATLGFEVDGAEFLEDGIPHVPMRRPVQL